MTTKRSEQNQDESLKPSKELQLGSRKVSKQNKSNIVTLPRVFIENSCKSENMEVNNAILLKEWQKNENNGLVKPGKKFLLKTWLAKTKKKNWPIRRFVLEF